MAKDVTIEFQHPNRAAKGDKEHVFTGAGDGFKVEGSGSKTKGKTKESLGKIPVQKVTTTPIKGLEVDQPKQTRQPTQPVTPQTYASPKTTFQPAYVPAPPVASKAYAPSGVYSSGAGSKVSTSTFDFAAAISKAFGGGGS